MSEKIKPLLLEEPTEEIRRKQAQIEFFTRAREATGSKKPTLVTILQSHNQLDKYYQNSIK